MYGWTGNILRVDLTERKITKSPTEQYVPGLIGARGVGARMYWEEVPPECGAFDAENRLIVMTGPATGTLAPAAGKFYIGHKSPAPLNECYTYSIISGHFGATLKFAGYDGIVVKGKASTPVYLWIHDGEVEIRSALRLWGMTTRNVYRELHAVHGVKARALIIGPAGENLCREAIISTDAAHATGIGGGGAVMGSKNLKAIVAHGTGQVTIAKPKELIGLFSHYSRLLNRKPNEPEYPAVNKSLTYYMYHSPHIPRCPGHPKKPTDQAAYFKNNGLDDPISLMAEPVRSGQIKLKWGGCHACPVCCSVTYQSNDPDIPSGSGHCNAMESWPMHTWPKYKKVVGIPDILLNRYMDDLGLSATNTCGYHFVWFYELIRLGILTKENLGVPIDEPWSAEFIKGILEKVAYRQGMGDKLAEGQERFLTKVAAEHPAARKVYEDIIWHPGYYVHWAGGDDLHPILGSAVSTLIQATEARAVMNKVVGNFAKSGLDIAGLSAEELRKVQKHGNLRYFGSEDATDLPGEPKSWRNKPQTAIICQNLSAIMDSVTMCGWANCPPLYTRYTDDKLGDEAQGAKIYAAVTGIETTQDEMLAAMNPIFNIERCIQVREGRRRQHDLYPEYLYRRDLLSWTNPQEFSAALDEYYDLRGWDRETGIPKRQTLVECGLADIADELEMKYGVFA